MSAPTPAAPAAVEPPAVDPVTPDAPVATPGAPAVPAKKSLEDSLASVDEETRAFVLAEVAKARKEAGDARGNAKKLAADAARSELAQTIGKALGLVQDEPIDPVKLTEQLTATSAEAKRAKTELAIFHAATAQEANAALLLDSRSFMAKVEALDPTDTAGITAAVAEAVAANVALKDTQRRLPAPNKAQGTSAAGVPDTETLIADAQKRGDIKAVIALQNRKLTAPQR